MNDELEMACQKVTVAYLEVLYRYLGTDIDERPQQTLYSTFGYSGQDSSGVPSKYKPKTSVEPPAYLSSCDYRALNGKMITSNELEDRQSIHKSTLGRVHVTVVAV